MTGQITGLKQQKKNPERVSVFLDGEFAFGVSIDVAARLRKGQALSDAEIEGLKEGDEHERCYQSALHYLGNRPRSVSEVERNLREKEFPPAVIAATLQRLAENHYLDDEEFARYWLENRSRFRPRSALAIRQELRQKGVDREAIDAALADMDDDAAAWDAALTKLDRLRNLPEDEFAQKLTAFLARRGFDYQTARRTVQRARDYLQESE